MVGENVRKRRAAPRQGGSEIQQQQQQVKAFSKGHAKR